MRFGLQGADAARRPVPAGRGQWRLRRRRRDLHRPLSPQITTAALIKKRSTLARTPMTRHRIHVSLVARAASIRSWFTAGEIVSDWLHNLPVPWMALVIFGFTYLLAAAICAGVATLSDRLAKSFKVVSVGMLPSLGIIFGLFVAFTAAQVWADNDRATASISREASALRSILV